MTAHVLTAQVLTGHWVMSTHVAHAKKTCAIDAVVLSQVVRSVVVVVSQQCRESTLCALVQSLSSRNWLTHDELVEGSTDVCGLQLADRVSGSTEDESRWQHALGLCAEHLSALCSVQDHSADSKGKNTRTDSDDVLSVVWADW